MPEETEASRGISLRRLIPLALLVLAGIAFVAAGGRHYLTFASLAENRDWLCGLVQHWGFVAALLYVALYAVLVALSVPGGAVLTIAGGFLFGTWLGAACAMIGATAGATGIFLAARAGFGGLAQRAGPLVGKLEAGFRADAFNYLLVLRLVLRSFRFGSSTSSQRWSASNCRPLCSPPFLGLFRVLSSMPAFGNGLGSLVEEPGLGSCSEPSYSAAVLGLAALALFPVVYKHWRGKENA